MTSRRNRNSLAVAAQSIELCFAIPEVVAQRVMRMALAGWAPSGRDRAELHLMGTEKIAAFYESWSAMAVEIARSNLELSLWATRFFWFGLPVTTRSLHAAGSHFERAAIAVLGKGIAPVHRRAVANAKRLGGR